MTEKEEMRKAVVDRLKLIHPVIDTLSKMWDERTLETIALALGIAHVELDK